MLIGIDFSKAFEKNPSGIGIYSRGLLEAFLRKNSFSKHRVILFVKENSRLFFASRKLPSNWKVVAIRRSFFYTQWGLFWQCQKLKIDTLFVPSNAVPLFLKKRIVYVLHGLEMEEFPEFYSLRERLVDRWLNRASFRKAAKVITVSKSNVLKAKKYFGNFSSQKITVVYQGIEGEKEKSSSANILIRSGLRKKGNTNPFLLFLGNIEKRKNVPNLIRAFNEFKKKFKKHKLVLVGEWGNAREQVQREIKNSSYKKDIIRLSYVMEEEKNYLLKNSDCLLSLSYAEGFGRTPGEAMLAGIPTVVSDLEVFRELYADGTYFCNPQDPKNISLKIEQALTDFKKNGNKNLANKQEALKKKLSWPKGAEEIEKIITSVDKM